MTLYRFTFDRGSYDMGMAVVTADSMEEAEEKLRKHCETAHPEQGWHARNSWNYQHVMRNSTSPDFDPMEIDGDVALTYGVDG